MSRRRRRRRRNPAISAPASPTRSVYDQVFDLVGVPEEDRQRYMNYFSTAIAAGAGVTSGMLAGAVLVPVVGVPLGIAGAVITGCAVWSYTADHLVKEGW